MTTVKCWLCLSSYPSLSCPVCAHLKTKENRMKKLKPVPTFKSILLKALKAEKGLREVDVSEGASFLKKICQQMARDPQVVATLIRAGAK
jgi:C4-type Zn-finger protein